MIELGKHDIQDLFDFQIAVNAVQAAYVASANGQVQAPPITYLSFPDVAGDCHVKSGHITGDEGFVVKIATGFYQNPDKGLPSSNGMNLVISTQTGMPMAILQDEGWLTDMRTGIGGALATRSLAIAGFTRVLIVGTGLQARYQAECLQNLISDRRVSFQIWGRDGEKASMTAADLRAKGLNAQAVPNLQLACPKAQVIITTTPSKAPLIEKEWINPGTHITAIGADCPGKQELSSALTKSADLLVCDLSEQSLDHGELQTLYAEGRITKNDVVALGKVLSQAHTGRPVPNAITIADLTGIAAQDAAISLAVLRAAQRNL